MTGSSPHQPIVDSLIRALGPAPWAFLFLGAVAASQLSGGWEGAPVRVALVVTLTVMFGSLILRLVLVGVRQPSRRLPLTLLAVAIAVWAAGSASVSAEQTVSAVTFPAPGEVLNLASYLALAAFLLLDVPRRTVPTATVWLESSIVCGAAVCLAAVAVVTPIARTFPQGGGALLLAMLFPLINLMLAALVLAQLVLRQREPSARTLGLLLGFLAIAIADSSFIVSLSNANGQYSTNLVLAGVWGAGFAAITAAACTRPSQVVGGVERTSSRVLAAAAGLAVVVLVIDPSGPTSWWVEVPAIVTLVGTGIRLMMALREARGAAEARQLSLTDELTGLPNRRAIMASTDRALESGTPFAVLLLDLDSFKDVNDSLGHAVGDEVLVALARRLLGALGPKIVVARLGGDEFAVLALGDDEIRFHEIAQQARAVLRDPLRVDSIDLSIEASVGIAIREPSDSSSMELLRRADIAMYEAKESRAGVLLFDRSHDGVSRHRLRQGDVLRHALAEGRLEVWYQPQVDARTQRVVAVEALVRLRHPTDGLLLPISFLPDARRNGLMPALTGAVMDQVIADTCRWSDAGFTFQVAMNWAPPELLSRPLLHRLFAAVESAGLPAERLVIEVTEDSFMADPERARETVFELRAHGLQVSIDDYGTGFSSLTYLRDLPVHELKMDRSFVARVAEDERSRMIVQTTTQMARALGLRMVAEGVEDRAAAAALLPLGVDVFQGYHIARPMPRDQIGPWIAQWTERMSVRTAPPPGSSGA